MLRVRLDKEPDSGGLCVPSSGIWISFCEEESVIGEFQGPLRDSIRFKFSKVPALVGRSVKYGLLRWGVMRDH